MNTMLSMLVLLQTQAGLTPEVEGEISLSFFDLALKGGWIMIPIFLLSVVAVYIFVERYFAIRKASVTDVNFMNRIKEYIHEDKIDAAIALCHSQNTPVARMIEKGIQRIGRPLPDVNAAIENVGNLEISKLEESLPFLATIAGGAPMLGFLGTVLGMIRAFYDMSMAGNNIDVGLLSNGIYTAMVTTVAGLIVGIFAYFGYNYLVARIEKVVFNLEANTNEFMDLLYEPVS
ncbi:MAG TPA: MotA/TolQ/ExbB proton channel family protein [Bacteroidales bacterium]|nr:MotA/TolQ/ExbB proton channel family protein [Bacteroidales bacterium]